MNGIGIYNAQGKVEQKMPMANTTGQIMLSISINRKIMKRKYIDMAWYLGNII